MKLVISLIFIIAAGCVTMFFTIPQYKCESNVCGYDGIKASKTKNVEYVGALASAQDLESRRAKLTEKYNSISQEERQRLEELLPNNVDNIKLVLELETIAKKYGLLIENPKLETKIETPKSDTSNGEGQALRASAPSGASAGSSYGTFTLGFTVHANYADMKNLISDIEKNLRLIEITGINIKVPAEEVPSKNKKVYPPNTYDISIKAIIYYLKN